MPPVLSNVGYVNIGLLAFNSGIVGYISHYKAPTHTRVTRHGTTQTMAKSTLQTHGVHIYPKKFI